MLKLINLDSLVDDCQTAWQDTVDDIDTANRQALQSSRYNWPRATTRSDGTVVTSPRDIVDTGTLIESQYLDRTSADTFEIGWSADYATNVHEGEGNKPARPWTSEAIKGDNTAPANWQNPNAILDVPATFASRFSTTNRIT